MSTNPTSGDKKPSSRPATFAEIIGTGIFPQNLSTGNADGDDAVSTSTSLAAEFNPPLPNRRPASFSEIIGTGVFPSNLITDNAEGDDAISSIANEFNPPLPARQQPGIGNVEIVDTISNLSIASSSSAAGELNPPESAGPSPSTSTSLESSETENSGRRQSGIGSGTGTGTGTGNISVYDDDPFHYDDNLLQLFGTWIEMLVLESSIGGGKKNVKAGGMRMRMKNDFPPPLTSLNVSGRPRFDLEKVSDGERLVIRKVPNDRPEVLRSAQGHGRVKMVLVDGEGNELINSDGQRAGNGNSESV